MLLDEFLHRSHPQKAMQEYGVTPYPVTPRELLQPAGKGEAKPRLAKPKLLTSVFGRKHSQGP